MKKIYSVLQIKSNNQIMEEVELFLAENISWGWEEEKNLIKIYFNSPERAKKFAERIKKYFPIGDVNITKYIDQDWSKEWKKYFRPMEVEDFKIIPSWEKGKIGVKKDQIPIYIYPEMAFGTGHHPTTKLCIKSLYTLHKNGVIKNEDVFLDVGTGSGILSIAASLLGLHGVSLDIDPIVLENFKKNFALNGLSLPLFFIGTIASIKDTKKFNLIMANILLEPILELKKNFLALLKSNGYIIISGILNEQENPVIDSYKAQLDSNGSILEVVDIMREGEWSSIIFRKE